MISQNLREDDISALALGQLKETVEKSAVNSEVGSIKVVGCARFKDLSNRFGN